jgi:peroxiredoxin
MSTRHKLQQIAFAVVIVFAGTRSAHAEDKTQNNSSLLPGHSAQGHLFSDGPRQEARLMVGMPKVHFPISCHAEGGASPKGDKTARDKAVQAFFDQGVGQLHGFWSFEAERSFRHVALLSPSCAIAYWGMAMAAISNEARSIGFIRKAIAKKAGADPREILWIDSLAAFHEVTEAEARMDTGSEEPLSSARVDAPARVYSKPSLERMKDYIKALEGIVEIYPDDIEAKAFLVLAIWDAEAKFFRFWDKAMGDGLPIPSREAVHALASQVLAKNPLHPVHHYIIHLWDGPRARRAVDSAFNSGLSGPGIPHLWHMAGHTLSKLKRFGDATWHQEAAARLDHAYMIADDIFPDQIHNYGHNNDWLVSDLGITGRVHEALALAKNLIEIPRHPAWNDLGDRKNRPANAALAYAYAEQKGENSATFGRKRLFELLLDFELWDELLALKDGPFLEPTAMPAEQWKRQIAIALAQARTLRLKEAAASLLQAEKLLAAQAGPKPDDDLKKKRALHAEIRIEMQLAAGQKPDPKDIEQVESVPRPRRADLLFRLGKRDDALKVAAESVTQSENELPPLARYAELLWRAGRQSEAISTFARLRPLAARADLDVSLFARLLPVARAAGAPPNWRPTDTIDGRNQGAGKPRPKLESFGPARWQPPRAPEFKLPDSENKSISLKDYAGRPVILIFYLGNGCIHCLEQLRAFYPVQTQFRKAGIELLAVSTDSVEGLRQTINDTIPKERLNFPLVSDPSFTAFKAFRAYDGFEKKPLHGTFLIDGAGKIRWHDISFAPFKNVEFLLDESRRLLQLPPTTTPPTRLSDLQTRN